MYISLMSYKDSFSRERGTCTARASRQATNLPTPHGTSYKTRVPATEKRPGRLDCDNFLWAR